MKTNNSETVRAIIENLKVGEQYEFEWCGERIKFKLLDFCRMSWTMKYLNENGKEELIYNMYGDDIATISKVTE
ncbi:MAG: hypothetical protein K0S53_670 [Bacteroidetes bacterium]|jgi:hypothetical protein|nr:hypothetical protein [Bacteroidota bacterium]